jgi:DNA-binding MarR family transcriptional regulator
VSTTVSGFSYVLHQLVHVGPTLQRDLGQLLRIERATLSGIVATLVRKGLVTQTPDAVDQRQRLLSITEAGRNLWAGLPDPVALALAVSFDGADEADLAVTRRVLQDAVRRIEDHLAAQDAVGRGR